MNLKNLLTRGLSRTGLAVTLGCLWLIDGLLQLQSRMFSPDFANIVLAQPAIGQPAFVSGPINMVVKIVLAHPASSDAAFALIQLTLAVLIFWPRTRRVGLVLSVVWALLVWYLGEGLGGMFGGQASLLTGFPGAALLYAVLALAALPKERSKKSAVGRFKPWLSIAWAVLWLAGAVFQLLPGQNSTMNIAATITSAANGAPGWLGAINSHVAVAISGLGLWLVVLLALIQAAIGIGAFMPDYIRRRVIYAAIVLSLVYWVVGQDLGGFYSGLATDPSTGPLLVVFGLALLGSRHLISWPKDV